MYTIRRHLMSFLVIGSLAISAFFVTNAEAINVKSGSEIAGISVRFGGGYGGYYRGHGRRWGGGRYWGGGRGYYGPGWQRSSYYGPRYRHYYNRPYYYNQPGGVYFNWRR